MEQKSLSVEEIRRFQNTSLCLTDIAPSAMRMFSVVMEQLLSLTIES